MCRSLHDNVSMIPSRPFAVLALIASLLAGCSTRGPESAANDFPARKAYVSCAVTRAFLQPADTLSEEEIVLAAINDCRRERDAVYNRLVADHPGNPAAVETYMGTLHATMLEHISLRLAQARRKPLPGLTT